MYSLPEAGILANALLKTRLAAKGNHKAQSTPGARFHGIDINVFYLNTKLPKPRYMKIKLDILPQEIVDRYNLLTIAHNGNVYIKIKGGMYGLPEAGILANKLLKTCLAVKGYHEAQFTPGLYCHL